MSDFPRAGEEGWAHAGGVRPDDDEPAAASPRPRAWHDLHPTRSKPEGADYGFLSAMGEVVASSPEGLRHLARRRALPPLAWSPETPGMVPPWEVPVILDTIRETIAARARRELRFVLAGAGALVLAFWVFTPPVVALLLTLVIGVPLLLLVRSVRRRVRQAERLTSDDVRGGFQALVEQRAEAAVPIPSTRSVAWAIAAVGVVQLFAFSASIDAGALRRDAVVAGEWWRLFTAPVLHGHLLHFWLNYLALETLGRVMETRGPGPWVPIVFVAAAIGGGVASLALPPDALSVGASGGLMGMFGFLAVMAYRRKRQLPDGFLKRLLINIALIAGVGIVAYRFIDNAAHGGGLLAGLLVGAFAIPDDERAPRWTAGSRLQRAGRGATLVVWLSAAAAIAVTLAAAMAGG